MNNKIMFLIRTLLVSLFALALLAAVPAGASYYQSPDGLTLPAGWAAIHPPYPGIKDIVVTPPVTPTTTEGGGSVTISVVLNDPQPTADVTISVSSTNTAEGAVSINQLVFTSANYTTPQDITVTGQNDDIDDGNIPYQIQFVVTSGDTYYDGYTLGNIGLTNTDNDTAAVNVSAISGATTEAGGTATFTVVLATQPTGDVTIGVSSSDTTEGTVSSASLTFTAGTWETTQTVTVTGVNDDIDDGNVVYNIITANPTGGDSIYNGINPADVSVTNNDDDSAGFIISAISGPTDEAGGQATFTVALTSEPLGDVTIGVSSSDTSEGTVSPASLTFTAGTWETTQTVTVTGVNDAIDDGNVIYSIVLAIPTGGDATYNTLDPADVSVTNNDDADTAGITVTPTSGLTSTEATGDVEPTFTVVLTSEPIADVTIGVSSSDTSEGTVSPVSLVFTSTNWATAQTVTITGVNDAIADGNVIYSIVLANPTGSDTTYSAINPADVSVTNTDDADTAGITVTPTSGLTSTEATGDVEPTFTVVLTSEPIADITIGVSSSDTSEGTVSPVSLVFTSTNWATAQTVTITGVNDAIADGDVAYTIVLANPTGSDTSYSAINPADVSVTNTDDDVAGFTIDPTSGLVTTESGGSASFTVVLKSEPLDNVTLNLGSDDVTEGESSPTTLIFDATNWNVPQEVEVTGVDDEIIDGNIAYTIVTDPATSTDPNYLDRNPPNVSVTNEDDDVAGILVDPINGLITSEGGGTATFSVVLDSQPSIKVDLTLETSDTTEGSISPESLTFTVGNWDQPQTVTVTGKNDNIADGSIVYTILTHPATSEDENYDSVDADDVEVTNADDDTAGITVAPLDSIVTTEGGLPDTINAKLNTEPSSDVIFTFNSDNTSEGVFFQGNPDQPMTITFTPANWDTIQSVVIYGVDDLNIDGDTAYTIQYLTQSDDLDYTSKTEELSATNLDAPTIEWVLPENHDPYYEISSPDLILLGVEPVGNEPISKVIFYRWDRDLEMNVRVGEDEDPPYQFFLNPQTLDYNWNQIFAYAIDDDGDPTQSRHELLLIYRIAQLYLPSIHK